MSEDIFKDYKIILIGIARVGKTSLLEKLLTGKLREKYIRSIGIDKRNYQIQNNINEKGIKKEKNFGYVVMNYLK